MAPLAGIALALGAGSMIVFTLLAQPTTREPKRQRRPAPASPRPSREPLVLPRTPWQALAPLLQEGRRLRSEAEVVTGVAAVTPLIRPLPRLREPSGAQDDLQVVSPGDVSEALTQEVASARQDGESALREVRSRTTREARRRGRRQYAYPRAGEQKAPTQTDSKRDGVLGLQVAPKIEVPIPQVEVAVPDVDASEPEGHLPLLEGL